MAPPAPPRARERLDRGAKITVALLFGAWLIDYVDRLVINLALPSIGEEFDLSRTEQGLAVSAFFLAYAAFQIPGGMLADRFGAKRVTCWALLVWSAFTALTGLAGSFAMLLVVRFLFGAAEGIFPGASMKAVTERTTPGQRMSANGVVQSANAVGAVVAPLVAAPLIIHFGWRSAFFTVAGVGVFVLAAVRLWLPGPRTGQDSGAPVARTSGGTRAVLRSPAMWGFAAMFFGYDIIVWGLNTWVPSYLSQERGISLTSAGALAVVPAGAAAVAVIVGGRLSDRLEGRQRLIVVPAMTVAAIALVLMATAPTTTAFIAWMTVATASSSLSYMPVFAVPLRSLPPALTGAGAGLITFGGQFAGVVAPTAMGLLADRAGFAAAFGFLVLGAVLAAVLALVTPQDSAAFRRSLGLPGPTDTPAPVELVESEQHS
ncbi:MFS transporter [Streptomyces sp. VRA16 Mangrove soil]|uniref:MFS transporter n=1 Tax=Streptomyces sp. VRA16 Mangrove soil TaxID=2817434 RepID=UPI001A9FC6F7|nr:MFS transporter [Streptomyces sp. VRA16 Mangrove soil]MBO1335056.1 MFS transporter [Streptomyces sp. VRA16 Mangrove soil]